MNSVFTSLGINLQCRYLRSSSASGVDLEKLNYVSNAYKTLFSKVGWRSQVLVMCFLLGGISCSDFKDPTQSVLTIKMMGVSKVPSSVTGSFDPISETFELTAAAITDETGKVTDFLEAKGPSSIRVIDRPQIVVSEKLSSDMLSLTYSSLKITLSTAATANSIHVKDQEISLPVSEILYSSPFQLVKGKNMTFVVNVLWKNSVTRSEDSPPSDSISSPDFEIVISDDI
ncbi:MAG: hypothetical protein KA436_11000 [Oligoflexales bacterium]|nr:hypothetical protein [Oligoflexales bacterium]